MAHFVVAKEVQQLSESVVVAVDLEDLEVQPVASCERPAAVVQRIVVTGTKPFCSFFNIRLSPYVIM